MAPTTIKLDRLVTEHKVSFDPVTQIIILLDVHERPIVKTTLSEVCLDWARAYGLDW